MYAAGEVQGIGVREGESAGERDEDLLRSHPNLEVPVQSGSTGIDMHAYQVAGFDGQGRLSARFRRRPRRSDHPSGDTRIDPCLTGGAGRPPRRDFPLGSSTGRLVVDPTIERASSVETRRLKRPDAQADQTGRLTRCAG
jgi:hypothetical protein